MVAPGMLQAPSLKTWLGGIEPAWTLLDEPSFWALRRPPSPTAGTIRLARDLTATELQPSYVARNALVLLSAASAGPGLKLTATGNLSRAVVADMCDVCAWPDYDKTAVFEFCKVVNEPDIYPLFFLRHVTVTAKLLRKTEGLLKCTPAGGKMLMDHEQGPLQAVLFRAAFWLFDRNWLLRPTWI